MRDLVFGIENMHPLWLRGEVICIECMPQFGIFNFSGSNCHRINGFPMQN